MTLRPEVREATQDISKFIYTSTGVQLDTYATLGLYDRLSKHIPVTPRVVAGQLEFSHDALVDKALASEFVMNALRESKKIVAIKELRTLTGAGLKASKDAVEDDRVTSVVDQARQNHEDFQRAIDLWCCEDDSGPYPQAWQYGLAPRPQDEPDDPWNTGEPPF